MELMVHRVEYRKVAVEYNLHKNYCWIVGSLCSFVVDCSCFAGRVENNFVEVLMVHKVVVGKVANRMDFVVVGKVVSMMERFEGTSFVVGLDMVGNGSQLIDAWFVELVAAQQ
jgi:hypothetical protein